MMTSNRGTTASAIELTTSNRRSSNNGVAVERTHSQGLSNRSSNSGYANTRPDDLATAKLFRQSTAPTDPIDRLYELIGQDAVLLPIATRSKAPSFLGWSKVTLEDTLREEYQHQLRQGNVGVLLGTPSSGLCTIDIDNDDDGVERFLELNPRLRNTLRTKGQRGEQIWVRITSECPRLTPLKTLDGTEWGEWRSTGGQSVIYGVHPEGVQYRFINEAPVIEIQFEDIQWPDDLELPWAESFDERIIREEGRPYSKSGTGRISLNHAYFVRRFIEENRVLFTEGDFWLYQPASGLWERRSEESMRRSFDELLRQFAIHSNVRELLPMRQAPLLRSLVELLQTRCDQPSPFGQRRNVIHAQNGMVEICREGITLNSFHPDYYSRNQCPYPYDPSAECPQFLRDLLGTALGPDDVRLIQEWSGCVLLGNNDGQKIMIFDGTAGGGKSTLMNVLLGVVGRDNSVSLRTNMLSQRFEMHSYVGKTLLTAMDVKGDFLNAEGVGQLKSLVGGDRISVEAKGRNERYEITGSFNVAITCNSQLRVRLDDDLEAWRRRLMLISYHRPPAATRELNFADRLLREEGAGIFAWMIAGAVRHMQVGDYSLTNEQSDRVDSLLEASDSVRVFVRDRLVPSGHHSMTTKELQRHYIEFCIERGYTPKRENEMFADFKRYILEIHHREQRNDIAVGAGTQRGYSVELRHEGGAQ